MQQLSYSETYFFFFFNDTATTEIYTLSLHDALPISLWDSRRRRAHGTKRWGPARDSRAARRPRAAGLAASAMRSEEHTSELQSQSNLVCRLLLEKKKNNDDDQHRTIDHLSTQRTHYH